MYVPQSYLFVFDHLILGIPQSLTPLVLLCSSRPRMDWVNIAAEDSRNNRPTGMKLTDTVTILVVEDNDVDAEAIQRAFAKNRIANPVIVAPDGITALAILRGDDETEPLARPYLILLDLNMPRMNGFEFLAEVRGDPTLADSIIFVLTTSDLDTDKVAAYGHKVAGYIVKSKLDSGFLDMITMIDAYWRIIEFPPGAT